MLLRILFSISVLFASIAAASADPKMTECSYTVPVERALLGNSTFFLENTEWKVVNGARLFAYDIPADLVGGKKMHITFLGPAVSANGFYRFTGELGSASCAITPRVSCVVHYNAALFADPSIAWNDAQSYLRTKFAGYRDLQQRLLVAHAFHQDPGAFVNLPAGD
jgi:hypothetical protein